MIGHGEKLVVNQRSRQRANRAPGMTVVVVLGVISITLALSYAMLRSQVTSVEIQSNLDRRASARQAAYAGISAALRKMHDASWQGIDVPIQQDLSAHQWFEVSFATGDAALTAADADYSEYPFRVTIHSVGYAENPSQPDVRATYRVQAVLQLVRKQLNAAPASWSNVLNYTTYHWSTNASMIEFPTHVTGPSYFQGQIFISADYPIDPNSRTRYHSDLSAMRNAGLGDYRVLTGPIGTPLAKQTAATLTFLQSTMGLTVNSISSSSSAPATFPSSSSYRLYPGGKLYDAPIIQNQYGSSLAGVTINPDVKTNPLGIFLSNGTLTIGDNVTINGTIIVDGGSEPDIRITGKNVNLLAPTLPKLDGSTTPYQLPVAIVKDDFQIYGTAAASVRGVVTAWDEFAYLRADNTAALDLKGRVACNRLNLNGRLPWDLSLTAWQLEYLNFSTLAGALNISHFPVWLQQSRGMNYKPLLTIGPDSAEIVHHWHVWGQPVYVAGTGDSGLRWNLVDWRDNPRTAAN